MGWAPSLSRRLRRLAPPLVMCLPILLVACRPHVEVPSWFDAIHRQPIRTTTVGDHRIAYLDLGTGPPVIFVHGLGGSIWQWEYQLELAQGHRVIALDFLGSGWSDKPPIQYTPIELVTFLRDFMDQLDLPRASLVGNSLGAGIAMGLALTDPARVHRLVLIGGLPDHIRDHLTSPLVRMALDNPWPAWVITVGNWLTGRAMTERSLREMVFDHRLLTPAVVERSHRNRKRGGMLAPLLSLVKHLPLWEEDYAQRIGEITQPTLIIWGAEDAVFPEKVGVAMQAQIPGSRLVIVPGAGHIPMWERPDFVNPVLRDFLALTAEAPT